MQTVKTKGFEVPFVQSHCPEKPPAFQNGDSQQVDAVTSVGTFLSTLHVVTRFVSSAALRGGGGYFLHFTDEEIEAKKDDVTS